MSSGLRKVFSPTGDNGSDLSAKARNKVYLEVHASNCKYCWLKLKELLPKILSDLEHGVLKIDLTLLYLLALSLNSALTRWLSTIERAGGGQAVAAALAVELECNDRSHRITAEAEAMLQPWGLKEDVERLQSEYGSDQDKRLFHDYKRLFHSFRENHAKRDDVGCNLNNRPAPIKVEEEAAALSAEASNELCKDAEMVEDRDKGKRGKRVKVKVRREVIQKGREKVASPSAESSDEEDAGMLEDRDKGKRLKAPQEVIWKGLEASPSAEASKDAFKDAEMIEDREKKRLKAPWELKEPVEQFQSESASDRDKVLFVSSDDGSHGPFKFGMSHRAPIKDHFRHSSLCKKNAKRDDMGCNLTNRPASIKLEGETAALSAEASNELCKDAEMVEDRDKGKRGKRVKVKVRREVIQKGREKVASPSAESSDEEDAGMLEDRDKGKRLKAPQEVIWKGLEASPSAEASKDAFKDAEMIEDREKKRLKVPWELKEPVEQFQSESASDRDKVLFVSSDDGSHGPFKFGMSHRAPIKDHFRHSSLCKKNARRGRVERNLSTVELGVQAVAGRHRPSKLRKLKGLDHLSAEASRGHEAMALSNDGIKSENAGILEDPIEGKLSLGMTRLEDLPDDVVSFEMLDRLSNSDLAKVGYVNREFRKLSSQDELWKPRYKDEFGESWASPEGLNWKQKFSSSTKRKRRKRKREIEGNEERRCCRRRL